jgi:hypothetical protein
MWTVEEEEEEAFFSWTKQKQHEQAIWRFVRELQFQSRKEVRRN